MVSRRGLLHAGDSIVRRVARRLPPARGEALLAGIRAAYSLLTGRRARRVRRALREPPVDPLLLHAAAAAIDAGDLTTALELTDRLHADQPGSIRVLRLRSEIFGRMGDLEGRARALHRIHGLDPLRGADRSARMALGRLIETSPGWLPRIPGPRRPVEPAGPLVALHLLKESSPHRTTGFTMRSRYNLLAARAAGVDPVVVTDLGFPRHLGVDEVSPIEIVDGIVHHRLDLGSAYPLEAPVDRLLEDQAWLTAMVARRVRPAVIHASSGHRGFEHALVGLALREHLGRPLVYEVRSFFESTWSPDGTWNEVGPQYQRRWDTETRAMRAADHVITIAEAMRAEIVDRGVDPDRVTVVPNGVDAGVFTPRAARPDLRARYGLDGSFTFGYVSNLDHPRENQELLVEATTVLEQRGRNVRCLIVGDGPRRELVEDLARRAGVRRSVVFTGRIPHEEVADHYALLDAFVVPRRDERAARMVTPLKPFEALAMARPLVVADLPALLEIAAPDKRGLAFATGSSAALATVLERLIDDPGLGRRLGDAGREWVGRERSWAANGPRIRGVYEAVIDGWRARRRNAA